MKGKDGKDGENGSDGANGIDGEPGLPGKDAPAITQARAWLYYRPATTGSGVVTGYNVSRVEGVYEDGKERIPGKYRVIFEKAFSNHRYAVIASTTAGYATITENAPGHVTVLSYGNDGNLHDAEIFLVVHAAD